MTYEQKKFLKLLYGLIPNENYHCFKIVSFILYKQKADMLLIDYLTYIAGLLWLWFGIYLESLLDLTLKHTKRCEN